MNRHKAPWYIWLSFIALVFLWGDTMKQFSFMKTFEGDNFERWLKAVWNIVSTMFLSTVVPLILLAPVFRLGFSRLGEGTILYEVSGVLVLIVFYFSGVYAAYRHYIWKRKNLPRATKKSKDDANMKTPDTDLMINENTEELFPPEPEKPRKINSQRKTVIIVAVVLFAFVALGVAFAFGLTSWMRGLPSYQIAVAYIEEHPDVLASIGDVEGFRFLPNGIISTSPEGNHAEFRLRVNGSQGAMRVYIQLIQRPMQDWEIVSFYTTVIH